MTTKENWRHEKERRYTIEGLMSTYVCDRLHLWKTIKLLHGTLSKPDRKWMLNSESSPVHVSRKRPCSKQPFSQPMIKRPPPLFLGVLPSLDQSPKTPKPPNSPLYWHSPEARHVVFYRTSFSYVLISAVQRYFHHRSPASIGWRYWTFGFGCSCFSYACSRHCWNLIRWPRLLSLNTLPSSASLCKEGQDQTRHLWP